jgi:hypothetical protein
VPSHGAGAVLQPYGDKWVPGWTPGTKPALKPDQLDATGAPKVGISTIKRYKNVYYQKRFVTAPNGSGGTSVVREQDDSSQPKPKKRIERLTAFINRAPGDGSPPSADPLGWSWCAEAPLLPNGDPREGWVRFHLLNEHVGGIGKKVWNLIPVAQRINSGKKWRDFEDCMKAWAAKGPVAYKTTIEYHPPQLDTTLGVHRHQHKFPSRIRAAFRVWNATTGAWDHTPATMMIELLIPKPPQDPGEVEYFLDELGAVSLNSVFKIDNWLASQIANQETRNKITKCKTMQDVYDTLHDELTFLKMNSGMNRRTLDSEWPRIETALRKQSGAQLRITDGWSPNLTEVVVKHSKDEREAYKKAALDRAAAEEEKKRQKSLAERAEQKRKKEWNEELDRLLDGPQRAPSSSKKEEKGQSAAKKQKMEPVASSGPSNAANHSNLKSPHGAPPASPSTTSSRPGSGSGGPAPSHSTPFRFDPPTSPPGGGQPPVNSRPQQYAAYGSNAAPHSAMPSAQTHPPVDQASQGPRQPASSPYGYLQNGQPVHSYGQFSSPQGYVNHSAYGQLPYSLAPQPAVPLFLPQQAAYLPQYQNHPQQLQYPQQYPQQYWQGYGSSGSYAPQTAPRYSASAPPRQGAPLAYNPNGSRYGGSASQGRGPTRNS